MDLHVPVLVQQRALANGAAGREWLAALPLLVEELQARWELTVGAAFQGGTASYVAAAETASGEQCVLKIAMPLDTDEKQAFDRSVRAHQLANGVGCVQLHEFDRDAPAMLLERLGPNLDQLGFSVDEILDAVALTLKTFWRPVDDPTGLRSGADQANWLAAYIPTTWEALGRPCDQLIIDRAVAFCGERAAAFDPASSVLVHGDAHGWNTCRAAADGFMFVDPEGLFSEPAHDLAVPMREYNLPLLAGDTATLARARAEHLAAVCDADPDAVWEWGFIERVSTGLANVQDFDNDEGLQFLEVAERCLRN